MDTVFAVSTAPSNPWVFLAVALPVIVGTMVAWSTWRVRTNRKPQAPERTTPPPWTGRLTATALVDAPIPASQAHELAVSAIREVGGHHVIRVGDWAVVGWYGEQPWGQRIPLNPLRQAYQLGVAIRQAEPGQTAFVCCVRPQRGGAIVGQAECIRLTKLLASEVELLAIAQPPL